MFFHVYRKKRQIYPSSGNSSSWATDAEKMKSDIPCNLPCKSLYHALLHLDPIHIYSLNRIFVILLTIMLQRVIGNAGFRMRINLLWRGFLAGRAGILFPLDESYVPPREIIYRWYVGIESCCTLIHFFQCDWMDLNFQFSLIGGAFYPRFSFFRFMLSLSLVQLFYAQVRNFRSLISNHIWNNFSSRNCNQRQNYPDIIQHLHILQVNITSKHLRHSKVL